MKTNIIFDLNNVLADGKWRQWHLHYTPKNWDAYYGSAKDDKPIPETVELYKELAKTYDIHIVTGQRDDTRENTEKWLRDNGLIWKTLNMRFYGWYHTSEETKKKLAKQANLTPENVLLVFDDDDACARMWRQEGFKCFQFASAVF